MITCKSDRELSYMRDAGKLVALTLKEIESVVRPGVTTKELDEIAEDFIVKNNAVPAFKGLYDFPATICASINEQVVHGIPGLTELKSGDIISVDVGTIINGYYGDSAKTFAVGDISEEAKKLLKVTEESLYEGIEKCTIGNRLYDISHAIQKHVEDSGLSVVRDYVGHGIGSVMHEEPQVPNFGKPGRGPRLQKGMTLAIEPMVNIGGWEVETLSDQWTVVTRDGSLSGHFEHTVAITDNGPEILTKL